MCLPHKPAGGHITSQCPNRRIMILRGRDEYSIQDDESSGGEEKEKCEGHMLEL